MPFALDHRLNRANGRAVEPMAPFVKQHYSSLPLPLRFRRQRQTPHPDKSFRRFGVELVPLRGRAAREKAEFARTRKHRRQALVKTHADAARHVAVDPLVKAVESLAQ